MTYLIGTDEAGYGPNLGPLLVAASVWEAPDGVRHEDLHGLLAEVVCRGAQDLRHAPDRRVPIADSKALYQSGQGLQNLEAGLWPALAALGRRPDNWREVWAALAPGDDAAAARAAEPWLTDYATPLPLDADPALLASASEALAAALSAAGIRLRGLRCRALFPTEFNRLVRQAGSKGTVLSTATLALVRELIEPLSDGPIYVLCDKHGGRNRYSDLLAEHFDDAFAEIHGESTAQSVYRFSWSGRRIEFRFVAKGEAHLPTALASMAAKYLRELAMRAWNDFWTGRIPGLQPTAGYPVDAKRFKQAIAATQAELGIDDETVWRIK